MRHNARSKEQAQIKDKADLKKQKKTVQEGEVPKPEKKASSQNEGDEGDLEDEEDLEEQVDEENAEDSQLLQHQLRATPLKDYWARPAFDAKKFNPKNASLLFQQLDADYYVGNQKPGYPGPTSGKVPIVRLFGVNSEGNSVLCHVRGYIPYFFIEMPRGFDPSLCDELKNNLNKKLDMKNRKGYADTPYVQKITVEHTKSLMNYQFGQEKPFLRVMTGLPSYVPLVRSTLETGIEVPKLGAKQFLTYESNILFVLRCMIDSNIVGANWIELPAGTYKMLDEKERVSHCQIEVEICHEDIISHEPIGEWSKIAPIRTLSFDIECSGRQGHFPSPDTDPVIQIANYVIVQGESKPIVKNVFVLNTCSPIIGADVHSFQNENDLLLAWRNFIVSVDPDIITGYNISGFDIRYLLDRATTLKVPLFAHLGRIVNEKSRLKAKRFSSKAYGTRESREANIVGRVSIDVLIAIQRDHKLSSYTLNSVSAHFLGEQKEEVHHSIISTLQQGDEDTRHRLAVYCLKDAYLPIRLVEKLMLLYNFIEMARVTGIPIGFILERGQQIKVISQLLRKAKSKNFVMPTPHEKKKLSEQTYTGAHVLDPKIDYYEEPIATLDFASLYPSIMIAHNLCYTTLLKKQDISRLKPDEYSKTPSGDLFVKASVTKGLVPEVLEDLLKARKVAQADLKNAKDPFEKAVLNGRQLALKVSANSVYGFTGATVGHLPCLEISSSVTAFGRDMIIETKATVEEHYTIANGYKHNAIVVYGDTDSVMVKFGTKNLAEAMELGKEAAQHVSKKFVAPIRLEFEKAYHPFLLMAKKRYAGLLYTKVDKYDKLDAKGIEVVRRDTCPLVRNVISTCLHLILIKNDRDGAIKYAKDVISDLLMNRLDISMLVVSKSISKKSEEYKAKVAHVELAKRMQKRDPSTAPSLGDRVPYVIVQAPKGSKTYEKSEDPIWALENNIPIDAKYYVEHFLYHPLTSIFLPLLDNPDSLFSGDHTRNISIPTPKNIGIMKFAKKTFTCLKCKVTLKDGEQTLCPDCKKYEPDVYLDLIAKRNYYDTIYSRAWTYCQRCQGSLHQDVLCANRDCPIFYMRKKVQKDLSDVQELIDRFESLEW